MIVLLMQAALSAIPKNAPPPPIISMIEPASPTELNTVKNYKCGSDTLTVSITNVRATSSKVDSLTVNGVALKATELAKLNSIVGNLRVDNAELVFCHYGVDAFSPSVLLYLKPRNPRQPSTVRGFLIDRGRVTINQTRSMVDSK